MADEVFTELFLREAERKVLDLRELLVRWDENFKAWRLLCSVPYWLEDRPAIKRAREEQRQMVVHALEPAAYEEYYRTNPHERPFEEMYGLTPENAHEHLHRVKFLRERLEKLVSKLKRKPSLLDCGCNDGWMLANLVGADLVGEIRGAELNDGAALRAAERLAELRDKRCIVKGDFHDLTPRTYDAVVLFEVFEHLPEPERSLRSVLKHVAPGGRLYISTPDGAVERGNLPSWDLVERKGHLWAWPVKAFAAMLEEVGEVTAIEVGPDGVAVAEVRPE